MEQRLKIRFGTIENHIDKNKKEEKLSNHTVNSFILLNILNVKPKKNII